MRIVCAPNFAVVLFFQCLVANRSSNDGQHFTLYSLRIEQSERTCMCRNSFWEFCCHNNEAGTDADAHQKEEVGVT